MILLTRWLSKTIRISFIVFHVRPITKFTIYISIKFILKRNIFFSFWNKHYKFEGAFFELKSRLRLFLVLLPFVLITHLHSLTHYRPVFIIIIKCFYYYFYYKLYTRARFTSTISRTTFTGAVWDFRRVWVYKMRTGDVSTHSVVDWSILAQHRRSGGT